MELLEQRELLAGSPFVPSPLGHARAELTISGYASSSASWGQPLGLTVDLMNIASEPEVEPLNRIVGTAQEAASGSISDAPAEQVAVFASRSPKFSRRAVVVGVFTAPSVPQNSVVPFSTSITLPSRPAGLPGDGGHIYLFFLANAGRNVPEVTLKNNVSNPSLVQIVAPFPQLQAVALGVPPVIQPGDTIAPVIQVANFGPVDTDAQGPVTVALVASVTPTFGPGSSILAQYTIANIPGVDDAPSKTPVYSNANVTLPDNVVEIDGTPITLPSTPSQYYIGVVVDPFGAIKQVGQIGSFRASSNSFELSHVVGPPIIGLPSAGTAPPGTVTTGTVFPSPVSGLGVGTAAVPLT